MCLTCDYISNQTTYKNYHHLNLSILDDPYETGEFICIKTGQYCIAEDEPQECPIQQETEFICPDCYYKNIDDGSYLYKNAMSIYHCKYNHIFYMEPEQIEIEESVD